MGMNEKLKICHVNVRSLLSAGRLTDLEILCWNYDIDILCVTETWLSPTVKEGATLINLNGFLPPLRCDRTHKRGGGVAIYVRKGLNAIRKDLNVNLEAICLEIKLSRKKNVFVIAVYRPPNENLSAFIYNMDLVLEEVVSANGSITCVVGDFNAKSCNWWNGQSANDAGTELFKLTIDYGLTQLVEGPTRQAHNSSSQLDLMFVNDPSAVIRCDVLPPISDHCPTILQLQMYASQLNLYPRKNYHLIDFNLLKKSLAEKDWSPVYSSSDANKSLSAWQDIVKSSMDALAPYTPLAKRQSASNKPWYNGYLHRLRRQRDRLFYRSRNLPHTHRLSVAYRKIRNLYVAELRSAERLFHRKYYESLSSAIRIRNPHRWWRAAKSACGIQTTQSIPPLISTDCVHVSSLDKAECLNSFFAKQCSAAPSSNSLADSLALPQHNRFAFEEIPVVTVYKRLLSLNTQKACGLDEISNKVLKECATVMAGPLAHVFNCSLKTGVFPFQWKRAVVAPIFKNKGSRSEPASYRPISLLPSASKVFESIVGERLQAHCLHHDILPDEQFGFLPNRSTVWQLLSITEEWEDLLDKGSCVHAVFLDMAKAFDRVDHQLLLKKLRSIGVLGRELEWFANYLFNRLLCTRVDNVCSSLRRVSSGVPQGSVLGPLLFIIFYRDLPSVVSSRSAMFADDTLVYDHCNPAERLNQCCRVNDDILSLFAWADNWGTSFNARKSAQLIVQRQRSRHQVPNNSTAGVCEIPVVSHTKHLGVVLSDNLSWSKHINFIFEKIRFKVFLLKRLAQRTGAADVVKRLYVALVRPVMEYANPVWGNCKADDAAALERVQLAIARAVLGWSRRQHHNIDVLKKIQWPTLAWRRRRFALLTLWELLRGRGPPQLQAMVPRKAADRTSHNLRNKLSLAFPDCRTNRRLKTFLPSSIALFNSLPPHVSSSPSKSLFLQNLDKHFESDRFSLCLP